MTTETTTVEQTDPYLVMEKRDGRGRFLKGNKGGPGKAPQEGRRIDRMYLAGAIRQMLEHEVDEESGLPRLLELIHVAYNKAKSGDSDAMKLLFERGYGKTPPVYQLDPRILLEQLCAQHGLTIEEAKSDPVVSFFFGLLDGDGSGPNGLVEAPGTVEIATGSGPAHQVLEPD